VLGLPLAAVPLSWAGALWTALQLWLDWLCVGIAFGPLLRRLPRHAGLLQGALAAAMVWTLPVSAGLRFGQVNAVVVALCLVDLARRQTIWWPRGSLIAIATAIKLTPGVFFIHWAVARRWRELTTALISAAVVTGLTGLLVPGASVSYWFDALLDPDRLGPNNSVANQSLRAVLMRASVPDGPWLTVSWLLVAVVVGALGFRLSSRLDRADQQIAVVAVCGLLAFLLSPVSWVHHLHWGLVAIGALTGDGRDRRRVAAGLVALVLLCCNVQVWLSPFLATHHTWATALNWYVQNYYTWWAVLVLIALRWLVAESRARVDLTSGADGAAGAPEPTAPEPKSPTEARVNR